ncbi:adenine deaminase C-terminal domain-containing protein, partial [Planktomarina temperata]|uniref:adenine deaminase C-terminal domain-containing protein n=1 Tax=Planktomarina temperata TaxID=1284658 RepID=UPI001D6A1A7D|nr:adenine deaminase [Planktomarina temperata]
ECPHIDWPAAARNTVHMGAKKSAAEFVIPAPDGAVDVAKVRVIGVVENQAPTQALEAELPVRGGRICGQGDICQIALVERHRALGSVTNGFVSGFGYQGEMAIASTVAHDSHHMIVVGTCAEHMALAANRLAEVGGGVSVWKDGRELALVDLPIAGLMSDAPAEEVAAKAAAMVQAMADCGCHLNNAYMQHSLLALVVIPDLRISDLGLVDVRKFELVPVVQEGGQENADA